MLHAGSYFVELEERDFYMAKQVLDFINGGGKAVLNKKFLVQNVSKIVGERIRERILQSSSLSLLYHSDQLVISTSSMKEGKKHLDNTIKYKSARSSWSSAKLAWERQKIAQIYDHNQFLEIPLERTIDSMQDGIGSGLIEEWNAYSIKPLLNSKFVLKLEMFPILEGSTNGSHLTRYDFFSPNEGSISLCPNQYLESSIIPARSDFPCLVLAHELAHAVDIMINNGSSSRKLEKILDRYFPHSRSASDYDEVINCLESGALALHRDFYEAYYIDKIIDGSAKFIVDSNASYEFVSFFTEIIAKSLLRSKNLEEFKSNFTTYVEIGLAQSKSISKSGFAELFSTNVGLECSQSLKGVLINLGTMSKIFDDVDSVVRDKSKAAEKRIIEDMPLAKKDLISFERDVIDDLVKDTIRELEKSEPSFYKLSESEVVDKIVDKKFLDNFKERFRSEVIPYVLSLISGKRLFSALGKDRFELSVRTNIVDNMFNEATLSVKGASYLESLVLLTFSQEKIHYIAQHISELQKDIAKTTSDITETSDELSSKSAELDDIEEQIKSGSTSPDLEQRREELNEEIDKLNKKASDLEDERATKEAERDRRVQEEKENEDLRKKAEQDRERREREMEGR